MKNQKRQYAKPTMVKKKSVAVISGSGSSNNSGGSGGGGGCACGYYVSRTCGATYYH